MSAIPINQAILSNLAGVEDLLPHLRRLKECSVVFEQDFGLQKLPCEPGFSSIRGFRQFGKSTWLEQQLYATLQNFGLGSAFYVNGDYLSSHLDLFSEISSLIARPIDNGCRKSRAI